MFPKLCAVGDSQVCRESFQSVLVSAYHFGSSVKTRMQYKITMKYEDAYTKKRFYCDKFSTKIEKTLPLQATAREVMTFFLEINTIWGCITRFPEVVAQKSDDLKKIKRKGHYHSRCRL